MRRGSKIQKSSFIYLMFAAIFNLLSFSLDQFIVQQEDRLRDVSREMINLDTKISTLLNTKNSIQELGFQLAKEESILFDSLDLGTRSLVVFNDNTNSLNKKLTKNNRQELNIYFEKNLKEFVNTFNLKLWELKKVINSTLNNQLIENEFLIYGNHEIFEYVINYIPDEMNLSMLDDYGNKGTSEYEENNNKIYSYKIYSSLYKKIVKNFEISWALKPIVTTINKIYIKTFINYLSVSDKYADIKNKNNFFILLSISSQILSITFLLLLFRSLVAAKVYD